MSGAGHDVLSGGALLMLAGACSAQLYAWLRALWWHARARLFFSVTIGERDESYEWMLRWLTAQHNVMSRAAQVSAVTRRSGSEHAGDHADAQRGKAVHFEPACNTTHLFWHEGAPMWVQRLGSDEQQRGSIRVSAAAAASAVPERLVFTCWAGSRRQLCALIARVAADAVQRERLQTAVWAAQSKYWTKTALQTSRPWDSIILPDAVKQRLLDDASAFLADRQWYLDKGIPYRRGYLLHGPPGCGKSSLIAAVVGRLGLNLCIVSLNSAALDDDALQALFRGLPQPAAVLLEDIDAAFARDADAPPPSSSSPACCDEQNNQDDANSSARTARLSRVTFSGLLNCLDGVTSGDGRVVFMTTNHRRCLDPALIRPGRVDAEFHIGHADAAQLAQMIVRFFSTGNATKDAKLRRFASRFARQYFKEYARLGLSMCSIQEFLMMHRHATSYKVLQVDALHALAHPNAR